MKKKLKKILKKPMVEMLLSVYIDNPCSICGEKMTLKDLKTSITYHGGQPIHKKCFKRQKEKHVL